MEFSWDRECYECRYTEANRIFAELIRMRAIRKSACRFDDLFQFWSEYICALGASGSQGNNILGCGAIGVHHHITTTK